MPTEELEQALLEAKWGTAESDGYEVIARLLDVPREAVVRIKFAFQVAEKTKLMRYAELDNRPTGELDDELKTAIEAQIRRGLLRVRVRETIRDDGVLFARTAALIQKPVEVCRGCAHSLSCLSNSYSTPEKCFKAGPPHRIEIDPFGVPHLHRNRNGGAEVRPTRIRGDVVTVTCVHPLGTYNIDVSDLWP